MVTQQEWLDAQVGVIGSVLIAPELAPKVLAETSEQDYTGDFRLIYNTMKRLFLAGKPADPVLVCAEIGEAISPKLIQIMEVTPTAQNIDHYIAAAKEKGKLLRLRQYGQDLSDADNLDIAIQLIDQANKAMVERQTIKIVGMNAALSDFWSRHEGKKEYLTWPIDGLNENLYAEPGDFIVLGGYPSDGKSALALQMAYHMATTKRVGFFSLETNDRKLFDRMMSSVAKIPMERIKTNGLTAADWELAARAAAEVGTRNLEYIPAAGMSVVDIQAISFAQRYDVIFVDYLQLINSKGRDRFSMVTDISIGLHTMAQSTGITVIALAQLSRPEKKKNNATPQPTLSSLRESGQIEQDADIVFMLYRPSFERSERELLILKNKEGKLGRMTLNFDGQYQTFSRQSQDKYKQTQSAIRKAGREYQRLPDDEPVPFEEAQQCSLAM